jgi:cell wall-associated NlpC family hydrolase
MEAAASAWRKSSAAASLAGQQARAALLSATAAERSLDEMAGAVRDAVLYLYTDGGNPLDIDPQAGPLSAWAPDYAEATASPWGVVAERQAELAVREAALRNAARLERVKDKAAARAQAALTAERNDTARLTTELSSISSASANAVLADHENLSNQVGSELLSTASLQFTPKKPLPAPLSTTPVALMWAFSELGKPYVWGATGPNSFDCSGLTQFVWRQAGVAIPRVAADQDDWTIPVPLSQLLPGDLVFYGRTDIHHVGIYIGDGLMINAPHTGAVVSVTSIWWSDLAGFGRVHAPGTPVPAHISPSTASPAEPAVIPTAGPVPSQTKPPKGWKPTPGSTTPIDLAPSGAGGDQATTTTIGTPDTTTAGPGSGSSVPDTTVPATTVVGTSPPTTSGPCSTGETSTTSSLPDAGTTTTTTSTTLASTTTTTIAGPPTTECQDGSP